MLYVNRGSAYASLGRNKQAIQDYSTALTMDPNQPSEYYFNRGKCYEQLKDYDSAIIDYNKAIELNPQDADPYRNLAASYLFVFNNHDMAIPNFIKAAKLSDKMSQNWLISQGIEWHQRSQEHGYQENSREVAENKTVVGVYYSMYDSGVTVLRFFDDGLVIYVSIATHDIFESCPKMSKWFNREYSNIKGIYRRLGDVIEFSTTGYGVTADYNGRFLGDKLILSIYSHYNNNHTANREFNRLIC
jgi:tetratricopeptide (TPR) repeat protein